MAQVTYRGGPLDGGSEDLPNDQLPAAEEPFVVAVRDQGPPVQRAGLEFAYDGLQHLYSYSERAEGPGVMWYIGSQELQPA